MEIKITIGRIYNSVRDQKGRLFYPNLNARMHWVERSRWTTAFKQQAWGLALSEKNRLRVKGFKKAKITVLFYTCQPKDYDNGYTSAKPLVDGIVAAGIIPDDSEKFLNLQVKSVKVATRAEQRTEISIKEIKR